MPATDQWQAREVECPQCADMPRHQPAPPGGDRSATDVVGDIDAAVEGRCAGCGHPVPPDSPSVWYCDDDCQAAYHRRQTDRPNEVRGSRTVAREAMRWRPDLVAEFDDADLTLMDRHHRDDTGLDYCVYTRTGSDVAFLRVDDGHRFVGVDVPWSELEASGPSEPFRRLERELSDRRRLDPEPASSCGCGMRHDRLQVIPDGHRPQTMTPILLIRYPDQNRITAYYDLGDTEEQLQEWLIANQLDPDQVRDGSTAVIQGRTLTVECFERDANGRIIADGDDPRTRQHSVPLRQNPPQAYVTASPEIPPSGTNRAARFTAASHQGRVLWMPEPPDLNELTLADLNRAVELPAGGAVRAGRALAWMGDPAMAEAGRRVVQEAARTVTAYQDLPRRTRLAVRLLRWLRVTCGHGRLRCFVCDWSVGPHERWWQWGQRWRSLWARLPGRFRARKLASVSVRVSADVAQFEQAMGRAGEVMVAAGVPLHWSGGPRSLSRAIDAERDLVSLRAVCADEAVFERALEESRTSPLSVRQMAAVVAAGWFTADGWTDAGIPAGIAEFGVDRLALLMADAGAAGADQDEEGAESDSLVDLCALGRGQLPDVVWQQRWVTLSDGARQEALRTARRLATERGTTLEQALAYIFSVMDTPEVDHGG